VEPSQFESASLVFFLRTAASQRTYLDLIIFLPHCYLAFFCVAQRLFCASEIFRLALALILIRRPRPTPLAGLLLRVPSSMLIAASSRSRSFFNSLMILDASIYAFSYVLVFSQSYTRAISLCWRRLFPIPQFFLVPLSCYDLLYPKRLSNSPDLDSCLARDSSCRSKESEERALFRAFFADGFLVAVFLPISIMLTTNINANAANAQDSKIYCRCAKLRDRLGRAVCLGTTLSTASVQNL